MTENDNQSLTAFFEKDDNVVFALLFGSHAVNKANKESDVDVAVYFKDPPQGIEILDYSTELTNVINSECIGFKGTQHVCGMLRYVIEGRGFSGRKCCNIS